MIKEDFKNLIMDSNIEFTVPPFSKIIKIYLDDETIYLVYEYPDEMEHHIDKKKVNIIIKLTINNNYLFNYKYYDTQLLPDIDIVSDYSYSTTKNTGSKFNLGIIYKKYHFFINEIKPIIENRDSKIENVLKNETSN